MLVWVVLWFVTGFLGMLILMYTRWVTYKDTTLEDLAGDFLGSFVGPIWLDYALGVLIKELRLHKIVLIPRKK